ncbi:transcriptional regulator GlxA family with amidase domain [Aminobacter lissarensis]|uniref:Transcriptional regulator GlxA family with amidase domain n=1 Tax=Aminobacter carboxidus TaxID=376165 RepID=A0A8E2BC62_9HYPH|nr:GlxA family transcriptional regulator [Aminobacter lissarensis]MBB6465864.1 transcriptional regulator GlxA family with amidase domain [Aminobacter lissarensis]
MNAPHKPATFEVDTCRLDDQGRYSNRKIAGERQSPSVFLVLLLPGFSQLCLSSLIDPLRLANALSGQSLFHWCLMSLDGKSVESASGISVEVSGNSLRHQKAMALDPHAAVLICAGEGVEQQRCPELRAFLRRAHRADLPLYALGTATWLLADAGLLGEARCTIHWGKMAALSETFYDLAIEDALFVRDGKIVTCAGDLAAFDLAVALVQERCGIELARSICQHVIADRWRDGASCQSVPAGLRYGNTGKKLLRIIKLMEKHIEDPLPLEEIAARVCLSRRQIERLFERHLSTTPRRHYTAIKLGKARQLIELTDMPVTDVAIACGFVSPSYFSKSFKDHFGTLPSQMKCC